MCRIAKASPRTIQRAFKVRYGLSPKTYLKMRRLNGVRQELKKNRDPGNNKISIIASQWGFWHMGQFARDYKRFFRELPSETFGKVDKHSSPKLKFDH